jgi:hypothetical protein
MESLFDIPLESYHLASFLKGVMGDNVLSTKTNNYESGENLRFHVTFTVRESVFLSEIAGVQNRIGDTIQKIIETGKVKESGVLIDDRKVFLLIEADSAEELFRWFAPLYDVAKPDIQPIVSLELLPNIFEELQKLRY